MECWNIEGKSGTKLFKLSETPSNPSFLPGEPFFYFTEAITPLFQFGAKLLNSIATCKHTDKKSQLFLTTRCSDVKELFQVAE
jgi:hypothetical protein